MYSEWAAILALSIYTLVALAVVLVQALRCHEGWRVWLLYVFERLYCSLAFHWRANRRCPFPQSGPAIIIANHSSPLDPLFIWMEHHLGMNGKIRTIGFLMAQEYYETPIVGRICKWVNTIPVRRMGRDMAPAKEALSRLKQGHMIGLFPEGRLNLEKDLGRGNPGVAWLALHSQAPVYPVFIHNAPQGETMTEPFYRFSRVKLDYGPPIDLSRFYGQRKTHELLEEVTDVLMDRLARLGNVHYQPAQQDDRQKRSPADLEVD